MIQSHLAVWNSSKATEPLNNAISIHNRHRTITSQIIFIYFHLLFSSPRRVSNTRYMLHTVASETVTSRMIHELSSCAPAALPHTMADHLTIEIGHSTTLWRPLWREQQLGFTFKVTLHH